MEIFEYKNFKIVGTDYEDSKSRGHIAVIFYKDQELIKNKIRFYNRTWERYDYQSVILDALYDIMKIRENRIVNDYKDKMKIQRITKKKRNEIIACDDYMIELRDVYNYFNNEYKRR